MTTLPAYERIRATIDGAKFIVRLSVPERRNAIGPKMANELLDAFDRACAEESIRVIVLEAEGKVFCAGGDFAEMASFAPGPNDPVPQRGDFADLMRDMVRTSKPIVAKVGGHALGGGFGLVSACTFAIAARGVQFGTPEVEVGLFPMMIMAVLTRFIPRRRVLQMMLLGEKISADEALALGVLNEVVAPEALDGAVDALAAKIASKAPKAIELGLRAFGEQDGVRLEDSLPLLRARLGECLATEDAREGLTAFMEKRSPKWSGR
jgi:enoyl-CoA hydratase/carnithine racemase